MTMKEKKKLYWSDKPIGLGEGAFIEITEAELNEIGRADHDLADRLYRDAYRKFYEKVMETTLMILREYVDPPVEGEITDEKLRERGIEGFVWNEDCTEFYGLRQGDFLISIDGKKIPWDEIEKL